MGICFSYWVRRFVSVPRSLGLVAWVLIWKSNQDGEQVQ